MNLTNFNKLRINDTENFVDVHAIDHSNDGVILTAYDFASEVVEIRRKNNQTAMFVMKYDDIKISDYWKDAEVIFSTRK